MVAESRCSHTHSPKNTHTFNNVKYSDKVNYIT